MRPQSTNSQPAAAEASRVSMDAISADGEAIDDDRPARPSSRAAATDGDTLRGPFDIAFAVGASIILWILLALIAISLAG